MSRCGKRRYADKRAVITVKNHALKLRVRHGRAEYLREYYCNRCSGWHLTSQEER